MSGCAVDLGPIAVDAPTLPASYQAGAEPSHATRRDLRDWWQAFRDPTLTRLIVLANAQNLSIEQARLRLAAGRALGDAASTLFLPTASGGGQALGGTRRRDSDDWLRRPLQAGLETSWDLGLFGLQENTSRAAEASTAVLAADTEAIRVVVTAEVASAYIRLRAAQQRNASLPALLMLRKRAGKLADTRLQAGLAPPGELDQARSIAADAEAERDRVAAQIGQLQQQIATLLGTTAIDPGLRDIGPQPGAPGGPVAGRPADLLRARPDIWSAEQRVLRAAAEVGIARAELYPKLRLIGTIGVGAPAAGSPFGIAGGPSLQIPVFDYGRREAALRARHALLDEALVAYRQTVIAAYEEAASALRIWRAERARASRLRTALAASANIARQGQVLHREGLADQTKADAAADVVMIRRTQMIDAQEAEALALVAVYKALGGASPLSSPTGEARLDRP
jgi:NodT family efflux transporter outer membrane factor (OMF) lipoprotein